MSRTADPLLSRAILIGTSRYDTLTAIPAVSNNLAELARVLCASRFWGLPVEYCRVVENPETNGKMLDPIGVAAQEATDTLLLYYAGHGLVDSRRGELHLALKGSDQCRIYTAVPYEHVRDIMLDSRAMRRIVILDCCYSGRALGQMRVSASAVADEASAEGTYVLTASAENRMASAPLNERYTAFTGELLTIIRTGVKECGPTLDLDTIYTHLWAAMRDKGFPLPQKRDRNTAGQVALIRNQVRRQVSGTVKWFNEVKGWGFISSDDGEDIFVHHSRIMASGYRSLHEGERVRFVVEETDRGALATNVVSQKGQPGFVETEMSSRTEEIAATKQAQKIRVWELANAFGVESSVVMAKLREMNEFVRSASSTIEPIVAKRLIDAYKKGATSHGP